MTLAVAMPTAAELVSRALEREYIRDAEGQFADVPGVPIPGDKLKLAGKIKLAPGEMLVSSGKVSPGFPFAVTHSAKGPGLRLGVVGDGDENSWRGRRLGGTVALDGDGIQELRDRAPDVAERAQGHREELRELADAIEEFDGFNADRSTLTAGQQSLLDGHSRWRDGFVFESGVLASGPDDDLMYQIMGDDGLLDDESVRVVLAVRSQDVDHETWDYQDGSYIELDQDEFESWVKKLAKVLPGAHSPESFNRYDLGVRSMPLSRALEAFSVVSSSRAVQLMMVARALEADDSFLRRGKLVHVERGGRGRFGHSIGGAIADAVKAVADTEAPKKPRTPRNAVAKALASGSSLSGFDREPLRLEAKRRGLDVPHGAHPDVIRDMLHDDENSSKAGTAEKSDGATFFPSNSDKPEPFERGQKLTHSNRGPVTFQGLDEMDPSGQTSWVDFEDGTGGMVTTRLLKPETAAQKRSRADKLLSDMPSDQAGRDRVHTEVGRLTLDADRMDAAAKPARTRAKKAPADTSAVRSYLDEKQSGSEYVDIDEVTDRLKGLSHAQLDEIAAERPSTTGVKGTRLNKAKQIAEIRFSAKNSQMAIDRGTRTQAEPATGEEAGSYFSNFKAGFAANVAADRERALAKKAQTAPQTDDDFATRMAAISGHNDIWADRVRQRGETATTQPPATPSAARPPAVPKAARVRKAKAPTEAERMKSMQAIAGQDDIWAARARQRGEVAGPGTAKPDPIGDQFDAEMAEKSQLLDQVENIANLMGQNGASKRRSSASMSNDELRQFVAEGQSIVDRRGGNSAKSDRINQITAELRTVTDPDRRSVLKAERRRLGAEVMGVASPIDTAVDSLRPMVDNPQPDARERTDEILAKLSGKQMDEVARSFGATIGPTSNVAQKRQRLREILVGGKLDSAAIARGTTSYTDELGGGRGVAGRLATASTRDEAKSALAGLKSAELKAVAADLGMRGVGSLPKDELVQSIVEFTVGNRINSAAIRGL